jgi:tetratricopeptide (TPR) repeat protein
VTVTVARVPSLFLILAATAVVPAKAADPAGLPNPVAAGVGGALTAPLAAPHPLPGPAPGETVPASPAPRAHHPEALSHYLTGRLLEERGLDVDAIEEYRQALLLDPGRPEIELRVSEVAARLGEVRRSLEHAERVLKQEPGNPRALWLKGSAMFNLDQAPEALKALRAAVAADSAQLEYWRTLAHVAEQVDQVGLVAECWRHLVELDADDGESWFQLAAAEARLGRFAAADSMLAEATALNPVRPGALFLAGWIQESLGHAEQAMQLYRHHLEVHPGDQAARRRLVSLLVDASRFAEAYEEAQLVGRANPDDPDAIVVEADLALRLGHAARAGELLDRLLEANPDDPARLARVAGILGRRGRGRDAVARAQDWAGRHPADYRGQLLVAQARSESGDADGAAAAARRAMEMVPDSLGPRFMLGGILQAHRRYAEAETVWVGTARRAPMASRARLELAFCREQLGNLEGAVSALRDVLAREPNNASALNFLGYLFADHNRDLAEAEALVRRALAQEPDNGAYVDSMGWVYYRLGRLTEARGELERAVRLSHGDPVVREHLGDVYKDLRLFDLARDQYRQSLGRDQGNARVRAKLSGIR